MITERVGEWTESFESAATQYLEKLDSGERGRRVV